MKPKTRSFFAFSSFAVICCAVCTPVANGAAGTWLTTGTTDWNTASNWTPAGPPSAGAATINTNTGSIATISANISGTPSDFLIGSGTPTNGRLDHTAGSAATGNGNWMKIGHNGGTGVYNLANTAGTGGTFTGFAQGSGSMTVNGDLRDGGGDAGSGGNGTINMNTSGTLALTREFHVGTNTSIGLFNFDNGTINVNGGTNSVYIGNGASGGSGVTGTFNMSGGTLNKGTGNFIRIANSGAIGHFNISGGTVNNTGSSELQIGNGTGSNGDVTLSGSGTINTASWVSIGRSSGTGILNVNGGTFTKTGNGTAFIVGDASTGTLNQTGGSISTEGEFRIAGGAGSVGTFTMSGGTLTETTAGSAFAVGLGGAGTLTQSGGASITSNGEFWIGSTSNGTYNMSGGTLSTDSWFVVGRNANGVGALNMSGGTIVKGGANDFVVGADNATASGVITFSNGLINVTAGATNIGKGGGTGTLTMSSTADFRTSPMLVGVGTGIGTVNLNGGTISTGLFNGGTGTATVNFNGGTLKATASSTTFIANFDTADILSGGALVNTQGFILTIPQALTGTGSFSKSGSGTLILSGNNTYSGATNVNAGTLNIRNLPAGGGDLNVADGATLTVTSLDDTNTRTVGALTLGTTGATTLNFDLGNIGGNTSTAPLTATSLALNSAVTVNITDSNISLGAIPLIAYTSKSGSGSVTVGTLPTGVSATIVDDGVGLIYLDVTGLAQPKWDATASDIWDITTTVNWINAGNPSTYADGNTVQFDDSVSGLTQGAVVLNTTVAPGNLIFDNSFVPYSITGTGSISGTTGLLKKGAETATLGTINSYTGVTELQGGVLSVASLANGGSPSAIGASGAGSANLLFTGGNLTYTGAAATINRGFTVSALNATISTAADLTISGQVVSTGISNLIKSGAGNLILSGSAANTIGTVNKGLRINNGGMTFSGSGTNTVAAELWVGDPTATGNTSLTVIGSNLATGGSLAIGVGNGTTNLSTTVTFTNSTVNQSGGGISLGYSNNLAGFLASSSLTLNSSILNATGMEIGRSTGSTAICTLNGTSTLSASGNTQVGIETAVGTVDMKDGSIYNSAGYFYLGSSTGSTGTLLVSGTASLSLPNDSEFRVGANGTGVLNQSGGSISGNGWMSIGRSSAASSGTMTVSGGTFTQANAARFIHVGEVGAGVLTISGTGAFVANSTTGVLISDVATSSGVINLDGGTLTAAAVVDQTIGSGPSTFNFNGGLLVAKVAANATFMNGIDTVTVKSGGARIDSNGNDIAVNSALLDGTGGGGLTKSGAGALFLNGASTYTGTTVVNAGSLGGIGSVSGPLTVAATTSLAPGVNAIGTFGAGATTISGTFACEVSGATSDKLVANGALNVSAATLAITELTPLTGTVVIASYTGSTPAPFATVTGLPSGFSIDYHYNGNNEIAIKLAATPYDTWAASFGLTGAAALASADPDGDGEPNSLEFALGGTPNSGSDNAKIYSLHADGSVDGDSSAEQLITIAVRTGTPAFASSPSPSATQDGFTYTVQGSLDLLDFTNGVTPVNTLSTGLPSAPAGYTYRTFSLDGSNGFPSKGFLRVTVAP